MSAPGPEVDERLYELYLQDCRAKELTPSVRDFVVWAQEEEYDLFEPEVEAADVD